MNLSLIAENKEFLIAVASAISAFSAILVISWSYVAPDNVAHRMKKITEEREKIRKRERGKLEKKPSSLRIETEPRRIYSWIVDRLNLTRHEEDTELVKMLRMAGFRGDAPATVFVASRIIAPATLFLFASLYLFVILDLDHPALTKLAVAALLGCLGFFVPKFYLKNRIAKRQKAIQQTWPEALDLMLICVESGMSVENAFRRASIELAYQSPELAEELNLTTAELSFLSDRLKAYANLASRTGVPAVKHLVTSLSQAERYGTPVGQSLRTLAQENRDDRMARAEKKAASLPPQLTVPMIVFFLPALFVIIITPAAIQIMELG